MRATLLAAFARFSPQGVAALGRSGIGALLAVFAASAFRAAEAASALACGILKNSDRVETPSFLYPRCR
jgi:hypothetical protein